jgi:hypothetical protein
MDQALKENWTCIYNELEEGMCGFKFLSSHMSSFNLHFALKCTLLLFVLKKTFEVWRSNLKQ